MCVCVRVSYYVCTVVYSYWFIFVFASRAPQSGGGNFQNNKTWTKGMPFWVPCATIGQLDSMTVKALIGNQNKRIGNQEARIGNQNPESETKSPLVVN